MRWLTTVVKVCHPVKDMHMMLLLLLSMTMSGTSSVNSMKSWNVNTARCYLLGSLRKCHFMEHVVSHSSNLVSMSCDLLPLCCYNTQTSTPVELAVSTGFWSRVGGWVCVELQSTSYNDFVRARDEILVMNVAATPPYTCT